MTGDTRSLSAPRAALISMTLAISGALIGSGLAQIVAARVLVLAPARLALDLPTVAYAPPAVHDGLFAHPADESGDAPSPASATCDPSWRLVGAAFFPDAPERSVAAVHTPSGNAVLGPSHARDAWTLVSVVPDRVTLRDPEGRECDIAMHAQRAEIDHDAAPVPADRSSLIEALGDDRYRVGRAAIEQASMEPQLRLVPRVDERGASVRVYGVRPDSLAEQAGIENGDVVTAIDGQPATSSNGLEAYARAMRGDPVRITVERRGQPLELSYELSP